MPRGEGIAGGGRTITRENLNKIPFGTCFSFYQEGTCPLGEAFRFTHTGNQGKGGGVGAETQ